MRITLKLDDDAYAIIKAHARARSVTLGRAASTLMRRAFQDMQSKAPRKPSGEFRQKTKASPE
jgi:hypothetical protein